MDTIRSKAVVARLNKLLDSLKQLSNPSNYQLNGYVHKADDMYYADFDDHYNMPMPDSIVATGYNVKNNIILMKKRAKMYNFDHPDYIKKIIDQELRLIHLNRSYRCNISKICESVKSIQPASKIDVEHHIKYLINHPEYLK